MAKLTDKACKKHGLLFSEGIALLAISSTTDDTYKSLVKKGFISKANGTLHSLNQKYHCTEAGCSMAEELISDSEEQIVSLEDGISKLADELREIYPGGKIPGTSYYYKGNKVDIVKKLKSFFRRYGTDYTNEQIIDATKRYIASFNGNYMYLKLLKYFIWKDERRDGEIIQSSMLADWIENTGQVNHTNSDWTTSLN
jgi:hypothetical protein